MVAYKPKRGRYLAYHSADMSEKALRGFIDDILGGGGNFNKFDHEELALSAPERKDDL
jgi:hypothetical protein